MKARVGRCFFFQNGLQEGEEDSAGFLVELFVVQDVCEPGKTFFLKTFSKKDGSKDYPTPNACKVVKITGHLVGCFSEWSWIIFLAIRDAVKRIETFMFDGDPFSKMNDTYACKDSVSVD